MQRFQGGLVVKAHRLCVSLNSGLESNKEEGRSTPWSSEESSEESASDVPSEHYGGGQSAGLYMQEYTHYMYNMVTTAIGVWEGDVPPHVK